MVECVRPNLGMDIFVSVKQNPVYDSTYAELRSLDSRLKFKNKLRDYFS